MRILIQRYHPQLFLDSNSLNHREDFEDKMTMEMELNRDSSDVAIVNLMKVCSTHI